MTTIPLHPDQSPVFDEYGWTVDQAARQDAEWWAACNDPDGYREHHQGHVADETIEGGRKVDQRLIDRWRIATDLSVTGHDAIAVLAESNTRRRTAPRYFDHGLPQTVRERFRAAFSAEGRRALAWHRAQRSFNREARAADAELRGVLGRSSDPRHASSAATRDLIDDWRTLKAARATWRQWTPPEQRDDLTTAIDAATADLNTTISRRVGLDWETLEAVAATNVHPAVQTVTPREHLDAVFAAGGDLVADGILAHPDREATKDLVDAAGRAHHGHPDPEDYPARWRETDRLIVDRFTDTVRDAEGRTVPRPDRDLPTSGVLYDGPALAATDPTRHER